MNDRTQTRVVVGVDDAPAGLCALRPAGGGGAPRRRGAILYAVRVFPLAPDRRRTDDDEWWRQAAGQTEGYARRAFASAMGGLPEDLPVKIVGAPDTPGSVLTKTRETDLLVLGASQRGALRRLIRRPAAARCLAHAPCPVLVVPAQELVPSALTRTLLRALRREADRLAARPSDGMTAPAGPRPGTPG